MTYSTTKFEFATSNGLGGDTFTRNVTDGHTHLQTDGQADDRPTLVRNYYTLFFSKEKSGYNNFKMVTSGAGCKIVKHI